MARRVLLCVAALVVAAAAFPSNSFVRIDTYTSSSGAANTQCTAAGTPSSSNYVALDLCVAAGATASAKYAVAADDANKIQYWSFTAANCAGTGTVATNYSLSACSSSTFASSKAFALSSSVGIYGVYAYSDSACATLTTGPSFAMGGICTLGVTINVGSKLEVCAGTAADCTGDQTCASISHGECVSTGQGSANYDWNSASSATPAVALTAALIAVVAAVTKF